MKKKEVRGRKWAWASEGMGIGPNFSNHFFFFFDFFIITRNLRLSYSMSLFFRGKVHDPVYYELQDLTAERFTIF